MKRVILTSLWLTAASYLCITGIFGNSGLMAMQNASQVSLAMQANIQLLQEKNIEYSAKLNRMVDSPEMIAQEGRSLGYLNASEVALSIKNRKNPFAVVSNAGTLLAYKAPSYCRDATVRVYSLIVGASVFLLYGLLALLKKLRFL